MTLDTEKVENKIDKILSVLTDLRVLQAQQGQQIAQAHMRINDLDKDVRSIRQEFERDIKMLSAQQTTNTVQIAKWAGGITVLATVLSLLTQYGFQNFVL